MVVLAKHRSRTAACARRMPAPVGSEHLSAACAAYQFDIVTGIAHRARPHAGLGMNGRLPVSCSIRPTMMLRRRS